MHLAMQKKKHMHQHPEKQGPSYTVQGALLDRQTPPVSPWN